MFDNGVRKEKEKYSNLQSLIDKIQPIYEKDTKIPLENLWKFYDFPYGIEIPLHLLDKLERVYYVPYLSAVQLYNQKSSLIFEFFETDRPDLRLQFPEKIEELSRSQKCLKESDLQDLDQSKSWFSVVWSPILCHHQTMNFIKGEFLMYYQFSKKDVYLIGILPCKKVVLETWFEKVNNQILIPPIFKEPFYFLEKHKIEHPDFFFFSKNNHLLK